MPRSQPALCSAITVAIAPMRSRPATSMLIELLRTIIFERSSPFRSIECTRDPSGTIRAGQLFTVEVDAEMDRFELLPIALSTTLEADGLFPSPNDLQSRVNLRDVVFLVVLSGSTPWLGFKGWAGALAHGLTTSHDAQAKEHLRLRLERVTPTGIEIAVDAADQRFLRRVE